MGFKVNVKVDVPSLKKAIEKKQKLIRENIVTVIRTEAIPHLIDLIMDGYDELSDRADQLPEDPTNPSNWRTEFRNKLERDFEQNLIISDNRIIVRLGDKEFMGYDGSGRAPEGDEPLVWLVYYIEGLAGDWGFITPALYEEFRGRGSYERDWGRFGQGFLISRQQFEEEGWSNIVSFDAIRHPFSGFSPVDIFTEALRGFTFRRFVEKALNASAQGRRL